MKKRNLWIALVGLSAALSAQTLPGNGTVGTSEEIRENLRFCESTYPYGGGMLVASFGTEQLNPLNTEGKGYILWYKDGKVSTLVPADGSLSAPKGMLVKDGFLYVCDVNRIVVFPLGEKIGKPRVISLPDGELFANDLVEWNGNLYVSVTNTDRIFRLDISDPGHPGTPREWASVPGPNGLLMDQGIMYVASYPADGNTQDRHVVYRIADLENPRPEKLIQTPGQYDGIAFSSDHKALYITNWSPAGLSRVDLQTGDISPLELKLDTPLAGPADISVSEGKIYIPDLPNSRVIVVDEPAGQLKKKNGRLSSHILDITRGEPVQGVKVVLSRQDENGGWVFVDEKLTDANGRIPDFLPADEKSAQQDYKSSSGIYKLTFQVAPYFERLNQKSFYPFVEVVFEIGDAHHYHVPLTLSPYGYSTYRGN